MKKVQSPELQSCEDEQIHLIHSVQDYGFSLWVRHSDQRIDHCSGNLEKHLGLRPELALGRKLFEVLPSEFTSAVRDFLASERLRAGPRFQQLHSNPTLVDLYGFAAEDHWVLEFSGAPPPGEGQLVNESEGLQLYLDHFLRGLPGNTSLPELALKACQAVRRITSMDRVMMYRFDLPSWDGEVIAEDRIASAHSFANHRFPAADIPRNARELYLRNQVRFIFDAEKKGVPLVSQKKTKPLDLSESRLRAVSEVHLEYLRNMQVRCSFSVAVPLPGQARLWGLIACHHHEPLYLTHAQRAICESIGRNLGLQAPLLEEATHLRQELEFQQSLSRLFQELRLSSEPLNELFRRHQSVGAAFGAGGLAWVSPASTDFAGVTPLREDLQRMAQALREEMSQKNLSLLASESLAELHPDFARLKDYASGVMAIHVPEVDDGLLFFFRPEQVRSIQWGGDPRKALVDRNYQGQINPRSSFETWTETVRGRSAPWKAFEMQGARLLKDLVFDAFVRKERLISELSPKLQRS